MLDSIGTVVGSLPSNDDHTTEIRISRLKPGNSPLLTNKNTRQYVRKYQSHKRSNLRLKHKMLSTYGQQYMPLDVQNTDIEWNKNMFVIIHTMGSCCPHSFSYRQTKLYNVV